jgi:hypothetical protein
VGGIDEFRRRMGIPVQDNLARAVELGLTAVAGQSDEQLLWLGAQPLSGTGVLPVSGLSGTGVSPVSGGEARAKCPPHAAWQLPVLDDVFQIDLPAGRITTSAGREVGVHWAILALHYLAIATRPEPRPPQTTFAELPTARSYSGVYQQRVIARLCATAGRDAQTLSAAAAALGGRSAGHQPPGWSGDLAFDFDVFPRSSLRLIWHGPDEEFPPSATLLLPENVEAYFCSEDIVVLSERLVSRLCGRPF